ncbi:MAG: hypothetical protein JO366_03335 [Methylobacteriaceae bacterium]|nr:hypothetical protein [Methylobacteriaceae bacterium]MBV9219570.1 hypothetical protein [Methylobacteriaceae bacterium]MBV9243826.1 hypothetical protein [Methylobacteriaceae bacterium]MBV9633091.1 hypothetical protein [Methylobacteriaceae bacterium]MBV9705034.1 hypothetical protein [Methylobacteriaceae bacterium]
MKRLVAISLLGLSVASCNSPDPGDRATSGALLGGAAGALIGGAATGRASGALVGGAVGAATGAVVGASSTPAPRPCARYGYDYYGNTVCVQYAY